MEKVNNIINKIKSENKNFIDFCGWEEFKIGEILENLGNGSDLIKNSEIGEINLISSTEQNNGITKKIKNGKKLFSKNKLTLAKNGSVGTIFYQNENFYATSDIMVLYSKYLNKNIAIFLKISIEKYTKKFSWGNKINLPKFNNLSIYLPSKNNEPDWEYMDNYIEKLRDRINLGEKIVGGGYKYLIEKIINKIKCENKNIIDIGEWKEFKIGEIFNVFSTKTRELAKYEKTGDIAFISGTSLNNGVEKFIYTDEKLEEGNCITVSSLDCSAFYQKNDFIGRGHGVVQRIYNIKLNKNNALFISCIIKKQIGKKYNYSNQCFMNTLKQESIYLPSKNNEPDWEYMDNYINNLIKKLGLVKRI